MPKRLVNLGGGPGLLEVASYARRGPARRDHFSSAQVALIARTVHRAPEVIVKVLSHGGKDLKAVRSHLRYLSRNGALDLETDDGQELSGKGIAGRLTKDWDLDLDELRPSAELRVPGGRLPPRLVHKLIFSMPAGTPSEKVLEAVRRLAREEFALKHRYALVLHTDEPHPHVHVVVKALGEDGKRLNIRKETLRGWRSEFARHLRELGVPANATERVARGISQVPKHDGIFRADLRGASTHQQSRRAAVKRELREGTLKAEAGRAGLRQSRQSVLRGWAAVAQTLDAQDEPALAAAVRQFARAMPPPLTEKEQIAADLRRRTGRRGDPERVR